MKIKGFMFLTVVVVLLGVTNVFTFEKGIDDDIRDEEMSMSTPPMPRADYDDSKDRCDGKPRRDCNKKMNPADMEKVWEKRHNKHMDEIQRDLGLSDSQREKMSEILKDGWNKIKREKDKMREKVKAIMDDNDEKLAKVLQPEQMDRLKALRKMDMRKHKDKRKYKKHKKGDYNKNFDKYIPKDDEKLN